MSTYETGIRIYVACLAAYNAGTLHGAWINLDDCDDLDDLQESVDRMLAASPEEDAEEFAIHDKCGANFGVFDGLETVWEVHTEAIDSGNPAAFLAYCDCVGSATAQEFQDAYEGEYHSSEDFARELADSIGAIDNEASWPHSCIDWAYAARELMWDYFEHDGHYFRNI